MIGHCEKPCATVPLPCKKPELECHQEFVPINKCAVKQELPCHEAEAVMEGRAKLVAVPAGAGAAAAALAHVAEQKYEHHAKHEKRTNWGMLFAVAVVLFILALILLWVWNPRDLRDSNDPSDDCNDRSVVRYMVVALILALGFIAAAYAICACKRRVKKDC